MQTHQWAATERKNRKGATLWICARPTCGHPIYAQELPPATACGDTTGSVERTDLGCKGCGQGSNAEKHRDRPIPADYPGAAE